MKTDHTKFANVGDYTHKEIDEHIDNVSNPHSVTATQLKALPGGSTDAVSYGANITVDFGTYATRRVTLTGNTNITLSNMANGGVYRLLIIQDGTGSRLVSSWVTSITWLMGGSAPTLSTGAGKTDWITFIKENDVIYGAATVA